MPLLLSLALAAPAPGPLDGSVRLDPVRAGVVTGVAAAPEGVLRVELYVLPSGTPVASVSPSLPAGEVTFSLAWPADRTADLRVVATTPLRGLSADTRYVVPAAPAEPGPAPVAPRRAAVARPAPPVARPPAAPAPGAYQGGYAPTLPYPPVPRAPAPAGAPAALTRPVVSAERGREGGFAVATGLLLLVCTAHAHRLMTGEDNP